PSRLYPMSPALHCAASGRPVGAASLDNVSRGCAVSLIQQTLSHFRVLEEIGAGGMGVVYRAHDEQLDRDVALKVLPPGLLADDSARRRFHREALAIAKLNHPNVGAVYEFGGHEGVDFLAMELVAGQALDAKLRSGLLTIEEII